MKVSGYIYEEEDGVFFDFFFGLEVMYYVEGFMFYLIFVDGSGVGVNNLFIFLFKGE